MLVHAGATVRSHLARARCSQRRVALLDFVAQHALVASGTITASRARIGRSASYLPYAEAAICRR